MAECHVCQFSDLESVHQPGRTTGLVSSDAQTVSAQVAWVACARCRTVQKVLDDDWRRMTDDIYRRYDINHQASDDEPRIFNTAFGSGPRTEILLRYLLQSMDVPSTGKLLDVGCSDGNLFKTFFRHRPSWELYGSEISGTLQETVLKLPGVRGFYVGREITYPDQYDLITMSHVLEHIPNPAAFLRKLTQHLTSNGKFVVIVPNIRQNPIDLLIADHCSHFDANSLRFVISSAGLGIDHLATQVISKELIVVAGTTGDSLGGEPDEGGPVPIAELCRGYFRLFAGVRDAAKRSCSQASHFGIMGSSIAAAWLTQEVDGRVEFFVDEDESRWGHAFMERPILSFTDVPPGSTVFIPMSAAVAEKIISRAQGLPIGFDYLDWNRV
jgi:SAM-dependent methyltransferase